MAQRVFCEAGELLGAHVKALAPQAEASLITGGLHVVAVGSVLTYCWDLLREGMVYRPWHRHACEPFYIVLCRISLWAPRSSG